ncbi:hypothetical protein [Sphingomonas sp. PB4P5]|uniref:hypothetical protein n=1 Tax=Parasphingomonas puruogangriensis TaxID=3096155 RepID=UPI002FC68F83
MTPRRKMLFAFGLALAAPVSAQRGDVPNPADPYIHRQTGMAFPARVGSAIRHQVVRYNDDGADSGVGYQIARVGEPDNDGMVAYLSIFVYPTQGPPAGATASDGAARERACAATFEGMKHDILAREPDATVQVEERIEATSSATIRPSGRRIVYRGGTMPFAGKEQAVREEARLFCIPGGKWLVSYRVTSPASVDADVDVARVIAALRWPDTLGR